MKPGDRLILNRDFKPLPTAVTTGTLLAIYLNGKMLVKLDHRDEAEYLYDPEWWEPMFKDSSDPVV